MFHSTYTGAAPKFYFDGEKEASCAAATTPVGGRGDGTAASGAPLRSPASASPSRPSAAPPRSLSLSLSLSVASSSVSSRDQISKKARAFRTSAPTGTALPSSATEWGLGARIVLACELAVVWMSPRSQGCVAPQGKLIRARKRKLLTCTHSKLEEAHECNHTPHTAVALLTYEIMSVSLSGSLWFSLSLESVSLSLCMSL